MIALLRRFGREVHGILSQAIEENKDAIAAGAVSPDSLLGITCGTRDCTTVALDEGEGDTVPSVGPDRVYSEDPHSFEVRLAIDSERQRTMIEGMPPLTERTSFDLFNTLVEQNRRDAAERRVPENYGSISAPALAEELGIEESWLRRRVLRIRKQIEERLFKASSERVHLNAVIENPSKGSGYRLNPYVWVVEPTEIEPSA